MKPKKLGKVERTSRGFEVVNFKDHYGTKCSLQASSLAIYEKPGTSAIWLGCDEANPKVLHGDAAALGVKTVSDNVNLTTRMHLNREQVEALIPMLQSWLKRDTFKVKATPAFHALPCSRSLSESKVEEIIATLWTILWAVLFVNHAPVWMLWVSGLKAIADHLCAVRAAIREIRSENDLGVPPLGRNGTQTTQ